MEPVRWGILGTASIARRMAVPAMQRTPFALPYAVASRDAARAAAFAKEFDIPHSYGTYDDLLADPSVDAVYIPLPNDQHKDWVLRSIEAGKHVLCEKPLTLCADEVLPILAAARKRDLFVMEAVVSHFHPVHERARALAHDGTIGDIHRVRMSLESNFSERPNDFRWKKELGGGALLDLGCYCIRTSRYLLRDEPLRVSATSTFHPETGVDVNSSILLSFPSGVGALIECAMLSAVRNTYEITGTAGRVIVEIPFGNSVTKRKILVVDAKGNPIHEEITNGHQFDLQIHAVSRAVALREASPIPLEESLRTMRILDACLLSAARDGESIRL